MKLIVMGGLFFFSSAIYWYLQLSTGILSKRYYFKIVLLLVNAIVGLWFAVLTWVADVNSLLTTLPGVVAAILGLAALAFGLTELVVLHAYRPRSLHSLSRSLAKFNSPTERITLRTDDGVRIQAVHLRSAPQRRSIIIVCHGAVRNKDIHANVITCELLFEEYDVLTFDFRGHQESGGKWRGDGSSKYDLKAAIEHARRQGYEKVGVVGWSFGAWTAILEVAEYHNVDSVVAAAPIPTTVREAKAAKPLFTWGFKFWALPARIGLTVVRGIRIGKYADHPSLMDFVDKVSPVPLLIVCNEYDLVIGMHKDKFIELYDKARHPKQLEVLHGKGHIYDWPNTFYYLTLVRHWLAETLSS